MFTVAVTPPPVLPPELEDEELLELDEELLDEDEDELLVVLEPELELLELELELLELEEELLVVEPPTGPLQLPAPTPLPEICRLSIFARPALVVACKRSRLLPATRFTEAVALAQVAQAPVPAKGRLAAVLLLTRRLAERAEEPLA